MNYSKCPVTFDSETRIWKNLSSINGELKVLSLGEIILKELNAFDRDRIIEINIDRGIETTAFDMKILTINFALNLQRFGIQKGDVVVLFCSMNPYTTPLIYACLIIGAVFVPLETLYTDDVIEYIFELVNPSLIAYDHVYHDKLTKIIGNLNSNNIKHFLPFESQKNGNSIRQQLDENRNSFKGYQPPKLGNPENVLAAFILTSGTTGRPKLMAHSHAQLGLGAVTYWNVNNSNIVYVASPLRWISQISSILQPILQHCTRAYATQPPSPKVCAETIKKYNITHFFSVSAFMKRVLEYCLDHNDDKKPEEHIKSLEAILTGGERISTKILNVIAKLNPNCFVIQVYGMTEMAGSISNNIGTNMKGGYYLIPGIEAKIVNENGEQLMHNQNGLICLRSPVKFGLYWKNLTANQKAFTDDGWLITGDYGKFDENNQMHVYNRFDDLIKFDGKYIIPTVLEAVLDSHPLLDGSFIIGIPHKDKNRGESPIAFCKLNQINFEKSNLSIDEVKANIMEFMNFNTSKDQTLPTQIFFTNDYPYTSCGKVDKIKLRSLAMANKFDFIK